jgi:hypothetical protein
MKKYCSTVFTYYNYFFSQTKIMNGLGKAKIGMSILNFNAVLNFHTKQNLVYKEMHWLKITDDIVIKMWLMDSKTN